MHLSIRVDRLGNLQQVEMLVVPVAPFAVVNFANCYPLVNPNLQVNGVAVPHHTGWVRVARVAAGDALPIGSALFTRYMGQVNRGWHHGYYLVHKRIYIQAHIYIYNIICF